MSRPIVAIAEATLWSVVAGAGSLGVSSYRATARAIPASAAMSLPASISIPRMDAIFLAAAADDVVDGNLFRPERAPADTGSSVGGNSLPSKPSSGQPKPHLELHGVLGGPPWEAILAGIPGRPNGIVVSTGEAIAGLRIRSIRHDAIIVTGADTTWHLRLGSP